MCPCMCMLCVCVWGKGAQLGLLEAWLASFRSSASAQRNTAGSPLQNPGTNVTSSQTPNQLAFPSSQMSTHTYTHNWSYQGARRNRGVPPCKCNRSNHTLFFTAVEQIILYFKFNLKTTREDAAVMFIEEKILSPVLLAACYLKTRWWQQVQSAALQSCSRLGILQNNLGHWGKYEVKEREGLVFHSQCLLFYVHSEKKTAALCSTKPIRFFAQECLNQWRNWRHHAEFEADIL